MEFKIFRAIGLPRSGTTLCKQIFSRIFTAIDMSHEYQEEDIEIDLIIKRDIRDSMVSLAQTVNFDFSMIKTENDVENFIMNNGDGNYVLHSSVNIFSKYKKNIPILNYEEFVDNRKVVIDFAKNNYDIEISEETERKILEETSVEANKKIQAQFTKFEEFDLESGIHGNHLNGGEIGKWYKLIPAEHHDFLKYRIIELIGIDAYIFFT